MKNMGLIVIMACLVQGCTPLVIGVKLPDKPTALLQRCSDPSTLPEKFDLRDVLMAHADDVATIKTCGNRVDAMREWVDGLYKR